jgi:hypothetical protein
VILWAAIVSRRETLSLKMEALRAIHMPQRIRRESALIFLYLWSYNHLFQASSMDGPSQLQEIPKEEETTL